MIPPDTSSRIFGIASLFVAAFQFALVLGAPWGSLTWGGAFPGTLPPEMRAVAAFSMLLLLSLAWVVRARTGVWGRTAERRSRIAIWGVVAYSALGILANAATPSVWERRLWLPVVVVLFATSLHVALSKPPNLDDSDGEAHDAGAGRVGE